jgi:hypothetical protein
MISKDNPTITEGEANAVPTANDRFFTDLGRPDTWASAWDREHDWYHWVTAYKYAADILVGHRMTGPLPHKLGMPIVFLYRHHLELALKQLARQCGGLLGRDIALPVDHRLNNLWRFCLALVEEESPGSTDSDEVQNITRLLEEFSRVDPKSDTFRYPEDTSGRPSLSGVGEINLARIRDVVDRISLFLDCISTDLSTKE